MTTIKKYLKDHNLLYFFIFLFFTTNLIVSILIALKSPYNIHPDEYTTKGAIDYYLLNWKIPDVRSDLVSNSFCVYGFTRLHELNLYYFFAGKIGYLAKNILSITNYYRIFNILLLIIMFIIINLKIKKNPWLIFPFIITPQVWYIFSYATSDGFDFFLMFICIYQFVVKDSMLNKILSESITIKKIYRFILIGMLFALILMSKANYYIILITSFVILMSKLFSTNKLRKKSNVKKYFLILSCCLIIFSLRYSVEIYHYGFNKSSVLNTLINEHAKYPFKLSTPINEKYPTLLLHQRGETLSNILFNRHFFRLSFTSFVGTYGYLQFTSSSLYNKIILFLYIILMVFLSYYIFVDMKSEEKSHKKNLLLFFLMAFCIILSFCLSIYNSWFVDFQPQGRYLFPIIFPLTICTLINKKIWSNKYFLILNISLSMLSTYSYIFFGLKNLIQ